MKKFKLALLAVVLALTGCAMEDVQKTYSVIADSSKISVNDDDTGNRYQYVQIWNTNDGFGCFDDMYESAFKSVTYYEVYTGSTNLRAVFNYVKSQTMANKIFNIQYVFDYLDANNLSYTYDKEDSNPYGNTAYFIRVN